jgi:hypothetical protein
VFRVYYTVYKITNKENGKIYVGCHQTENLDDGYFGSGTLIRRAIKKYGVNSFEKEYLFIFDDVETMFDKEREIVNESFLAQEHTYNISRGGRGNFALSDGRAKKLRVDPDFHSRWRKAHTASGLKNTQAQIGIHALSMDERREWQKIATESALSPEARKKRKDKFALIEHQQGTRNSQFGTCWIRHPDTLENRKIPKNDIDQWLADGWLKGRKIKTDP